MSEPSLAIVMPAWNAERFLSTTVTAALTSARLAGASEVLVVDPGSTDGTAALAEKLGARVLRLGHRAGPAEARNVGVGAVSADVVLFLDADCAVHEDVARRVRLAFAGERALVALTGSYDDDPPERNFASQYMNLRHHFFHQHARREKASFWAGCGAVRRDAFLAAGGFDAARYPRPMIEDVELGTRLAKLGKMRLDPSLEATHLKRWTLRSVIETDIVSRAVPWSQLILESGSLPDDLNLRTSQRFAALVAPFALLALPVLAVSIARGDLNLAGVAATPIVLSVAASYPMLRFFLRRGGPAFAVLAWGFHQVHLVYSAATFALCALRHRRRARKHGGRTA